MSQPNPTAAPARQARAWFVFLGALLCLGCAAQTAEVGGETNWLTACKNDGDCDGASCLCGACTSECRDDADCPGHGACAASDGAAIAAQCGAPRPPLCFPACTRDNDCSKDQQCAAGGCVLRAEPGPGADAVPNPTGDCVATSDGSGIEHFPGADSTYLPDCEAPLLREYYRVFVQEDGTAYMYPRPENHPDFYGPCGNADDPLKAILDRYDLCQREAFDSEQVARVNAMDPGDALTISHFLHERLVFVTYEYGTFPGARAEDVLELCESDEAFRNGPMKERCDFEFDAARTGFRDGLGWLHTGEAGQVLVDALNALYGISGEGLCDRIGNNAAQALRVVIDASRACDSDADCVEVGRNTSCFDTCSDSIAASFSADVAAAKETLEENQCAAFERANCSFVVPPCTPLGAPTCSDGYCGGPPQAPEGSPVPEAPSRRRVRLPGQPRIASDR